VIAVDLNSNRLGRLRPGEPEKPSGEISEWRRKLQENLGALIPERTEDEPGLPSILDVITSSINIMQVLITRSRLAGEPADVMVTPRLADLGLMEFHRASFAIEVGRHAVEQVMPQLQALRHDANGN